MGTVPGWKKRRSCWWGAAVALVVLGAPVAPASAQSAPPAITVSNDGERPNVLVDQVGTAHVVWNQDTGTGNADILHYCRIPRGARACTSEQTFVPPETPASGNKDDNGPRIVQTSADQIVVLTHRYPSVVVSEEATGRPNQRCYEENPDKPDACFGSSDNSTWAYVTNDGGQTFQPPRLLGRGRTSGPPIALTAGFDAPRIAFVSDTETGGTFFQALRPDGYSRAEANLGDEGRDRAYSGSVAAFNGALPVAAFNDLTPNIFVRAYRGGGGINDVTSWRPAVNAGPGSDPRLAAGPQGMYLMYKARTATASRYVMKRVLDGSGRVSATSAPVSEIGDVVGRDLFADGGGGLHAAWVLRAGSANTLRYRTGRTPTTLGPTLTLAAGGAGTINGADLGAADDGGGFAVWSSVFDGRGTVRIVPFGPQTPLVDVRVTGIEVTQAVQSFDLPKRDPARPAAPVPYRGALLSACCGSGGSVARTIVRVFANSRGPLPAGTPPPTVRLRAFRGSTELGTGQGNGLSPVLPEFAPSGLASGGPADVPLNVRQDAKGAYTFTLPYAWTRPGTPTLVAEINPEALKPSIGECVRCRDDNRFTLSGVPFRVTTTVPILPLELKVNGKRPANFPDPASLFAGLLATSPLHVDVQPYQAFLDASSIANDKDLDATERRVEALELVEDWADDNNDSSARFPIGVVADGTGIGGVTNGDGELYSDEQPLSVIRDIRPLRTAAHEVAHGLGFRHAGQNCDGTRPGDKQEGEPWPPDDMGRLDGIGLDQRDGTPYRPVASGARDQPATIFDLMSYCGDGSDASAWITQRNWDRMVTFRAPPQPAAARAVAVPRQGGAATLRVVAFVTTGRARISRVEPDTRPATAAAPGAAYTLVARDATGRELARSGVDAEEAEEEPVTRLSGRVPAAGVASVSIEQAGAALPGAVRTRSANAPRVALTAPKGGRPLGSTPTVTVRWAATDTDRDRLPAVVEYSPDGGRTWQTVASGVTTGNVTLPRRLFETSGNARVRVRVNDGFNETTAVSGRLRSLGAAPEVTVRSPRAGASFLGGAAVPRDGAAWDDAGRPLTGARLRWFDGRRLIGTGAQLTATGLAPGRRMVTLEARDARGRRARRTVTIRIGAVKPLFSVLDVPAKVGRRARTVFIRAACTVPATLSVGGRRVLCTQRPQRLAVPVRPGLRPLTLRLTLTSAGKRTLAVRTVARG